MSRTSPAAWRIVCCTRCDRWDTYASYASGWPLGPSGGAVEACVSTTMALNHTAAPNVFVMARSMGRSPNSERLGVSMRSKKSTISGGQRFVKAFVLACNIQSDHSNRYHSTTRRAMMELLYRVSDADDRKPGVSISRSLMPCIVASTNRT